MAQLVFSLPLGSRPGQLIEFGDEEEQVGEQIRSRKAPEGQTQANKMRSLSQLNGPATEPPWEVSALAAPHTVSQGH